MSIHLWDKLFTTYLVEEFSGSYQCSRRLSLTNIKKKLETLSLCNISVDKRFILSIKQCSQYVVVFSLTHNVLYYSITCIMFYKLYRIRNWYYIENEMFSQFDGFYSRWSNSKTNDELTKSELLRCCSGRMCDCRAEVSRSIPGSGQIFVWSVKVFVLEFGYFLKKNMFVLISVILY